MRFWKLFTLIFTCSIAMNGFASMSDTLKTAHRLRDDGKFTQAATRLTSALESSALSVDERKQLLWEIDLLERIRQDFSLTEQQLFTRLEKSVKDLTRAEFDGWLKEGRF